MTARCPHTLDCTVLHSDWLSQADSSSLWLAESSWQEKQRLWTQRRITVLSRQTANQCPVTWWPQETLSVQKTDIWVRNKHANDLLSLSVSLSLFLYLDKGNVESEIVILILYGKPNAFILTVSNVHCKMPVKIFINLQYFYIGASYENEIKRSNVIGGTMIDD